MLVGVVVLVAFGGEVIVAGSSVCLGSVAVGWLWELLFEVELLLGGVMGSAGFVAAGGGVAGVVGSGVLFGGLSDEGFVLLTPARI